MNSIITNAITLERADRLGCYISFCFLLLHRDRKMPTKLKEKQHANKMNVVCGKSLRNRIKNENIHGMVGVVPMEEKMREIY